MKIGIFTKGNFDTEDLLLSIDGIYTIRENLLINKKGEFNFNINNHGHFNSVMLDELFEYIENDTDDIDLYICPVMVLEKEKAEIVNYFEKEIEEKIKTYKDFLNFKDTDITDGFILKDGKDINEETKVKYLNVEWIYCIYDK
jgi:hypothetical protein